METMSRPSATHRSRAADIVSEDIELRAVGLNDPRAERLERRLTAEMDDRYGTGGPSPIPAEGFEHPDGCFIVAVDQGRIIGCGGFRRIGDGRAEIKRMYVDPTARGRGVGRQILSALEGRAVAAGYNEIWLETGSEQPEAISLYLSAGYRPSPPYGEFKDDPRSRGFRLLFGGDSPPAGAPRQAPIWEGHGADLSRSRGVHQQFRPGIRSVRDSSDGPTGIADHTRRR